MPETLLTQSEAVAVLQRARLVRVAFESSPPYVIALGCAYVDGALVGMTGPGKKADLAETNPIVGFQVDTSLDDGIYAWESVQGVGRFTVSAPDPAVMATVRQEFPSPPDWFVADRVASATAGRALTFRLELLEFSAVRSGP